MPVACWEIYIFCSSVIIYIFSSSAIIWWKVSLYLSSHNFPWGQLSGYPCHFNVIFFMLPSNNKRKLSANNPDLGGALLIIIIYII